MGHDDVRVLSGGPERPVVIGFAAASGTGKTTLLCRLVPILRGHGLRVGAVKHSHHGFDLDRPGKDSHRLREAGVSQMLLVGPRGWALLADGDEGDGDTLERSIARMDVSRLDVILVEGYRGTRYPKIELYRKAVGGSPLYPTDDSVVAVAATDPLPAPTALPVLPLDDPERVAEFVLAMLPKRQAVPVLDARGLRCPVPVVKTRERIARLEPGGRLDVLGDDPLFVLDMKAFCAQEGHAYLSEGEEAGGGIRIALRRGNGDPSSGPS